MVVVVVLLVVVVAAVVAVVVRNSLFDFLTQALSLAPYPMCGARKSIYLSTGLIDFGVQ